MHTHRFDRFAHALVDSASSGPFLRGLLALKKERERRALAELTSSRSAAASPQDRQQAA